MVHPDLDERYPELHEELKTSQSGICDAMWSAQTDS